MDLVIDANVVISALVAGRGFTYDIIFNDKMKIYAPEFLKEEIEKYKRDIIEKSGLEENEFNLFLSLVCSRINFIPLEDFKNFIKSAGEICPDEKDREYFALALKLNCPVWSNDKRLKEQDKIRIFSTEGISNFMFE